MVRACCVRGCRSGWEVPSHLIPKNPQRCRQWLDILQLNVDEKEIKCLRVCHKHFDKNDYSCSPTIRRLLSTAFPHILLDSQGQKQQERIEMLQQQQEEVRQDQQKQQERIEILQKQIDENEVRKEQQEQQEILEMLQQQQEEIRQDQQKQQERIKMLQQEQEEIRQDQRKQQERIEILQKQTDENEVRKEQQEQQERIEMLQQLQKEMDQKQQKQQERINMLHQQQEQLQKQLKSRKRRPNLQKITCKKALLLEIVPFYNGIIKLQKEKRRLKKIIKRLKEEKSRKLTISTIDHGFGFIIGVP